MSGGPASGAGEFASNSNSNNNNGPGSGGGSAEGASSSRAARRAATLRESMLADAWFLPDHPILAGSHHSHQNQNQNQGRDRSTRTLDDVMRAPGATLPEVVVLESMPTEHGRKETLNPRHDLWLSTADG
jgi:hypothetical protein